MTSDQPNQSWISDDLYNQILAAMPIPCIDLLIIHNNTFLLGKRVNQPGKDEWYPAGGRVYKGETLHMAASRKAKEELGLEIAPAAFSLLTADETIFSGQTIDENRHSINVIFIAHLKNLPDLHFDEQQISEIRWFSEIDQTWPKYVKDFLTVAGFK